MGLYLETDPPETVPTFAEGDLVDPISGLNNVIEPEVDAKQYGWTPSRKVPQRGVMNWLHRYTGLWCGFIKDYFFPEVDAGLSDHEDRILDLEHQSHEHTYGTLYLQMQVVDGHFSTSSDGGQLTEDGRINFELDYEIVENLVMFHYKEFYDYNNLIFNYSYVGGNIVADYTSCELFRIMIRPGYTRPNDLWGSNNIFYFLGNVLCAGASQILPIWLPYSNSETFCVINCPATVTGQALGLHCSTILSGFTYNTH